MNDIYSRVIAAGVAFGATKLAALGISLSSEAQMAITVGVYGASHRAISWISAKFGRRA